jgi:hypothetical protein
VEREIDDDVGDITEEAQLAEDLYLVYVASGD